ncbi:MAG: ABC transporter permease [Bacteroidaceae bacterium]|nr:ABC transporter permease [Bacteroidaceae bacterium]
MIRHYLELAWRQLIKYRLQSVVSIVSLAIGFACFALASMWIKYETTYDAFHRDAENLYVLMFGKSTASPSKLETRLLHELPQLEQLSIIYELYADSINGLDWRESRRQGEWCMTDTNFVSLVGFQLKEGTTSFVHNPDEVAVSDVMAARLWGNESPIGKELVTVDNGYKQTRIVTAVFDEWGRHSNFDFDFVSRMAPDRPYRTSTHNFIAMAHISPKADVEELNRRLGEIELYESGMFHEDKLCMRPITKVRHFTRMYELYARTKLHHIYLFALASGLLILCGLLNYLTLFINRLFIRKREMALRTVFGATGRDLIFQFLTEYGLLLLIAMGFGLMTVSLSAEWFLTMTSLPRDMGYIHRESLLYLLLVTIVSLLISLPAIWYFRRQSLQSSIAGVGALTRYYIFRRFSVTLQIAISIFCIFCSGVFFKQLDYLRNTHIGFERENRMQWTNIFRYSNYDWEEYRTGVFHFLKQCPELDTVFSSHSCLFTGGEWHYDVSFDSEDYPDLHTPLECCSDVLNETLVKFYGLRLKEGRWLNEGDEHTKVYLDNPRGVNILVNETFVHHLGCTQPIGQRIGRYNIVGIIKDVLNESPTTPAKPTFYRYEAFNASYIDHSNTILMKYKPGMKKRLMDKIDAYIEKQEYPIEGYNLMDFQEAYERLLRSELNLQKLLNIITGVCILIALFGVWSMIMLTCEQRRKEIAVRKVFGATTKDILDMFIVEYMALQGVAALVAFPIGYACMKPWLEQYVVQTEIPWWIYVGIFMAVALLVALCVGWRVWKTATAHPADEICKG